MHKKLNGIQRVKQIRNGIISEVKKRNPAAWSSLFPGVKKSVTLDCLISKCMYVLWALILPDLNNQFTIYCLLALQNIIWHGPACSLNTIIVVMAKPSHTSCPYLIVVGADTGFVYKVNLCWLWVEFQYPCQGSPDNYRTCPGKHPSMTVISV